MNRGGRSKRWGGTRQVVTESKQNTRRTETEAATRTGRLDLAAKLKAFADVSPTQTRPIETAPAKRKLQASSLTSRVPASTRGPPSQSAGVSSGGSGNHSGQRTGGLRPNSASAVRQELGRVVKPKPAVRATWTPMNSNQTGATGGGDGACKPNMRSAANLRRETRRPKSATSLRYNSEANVAALGQDTAVSTAPAALSATATDMLASAIRRRHHEDQIGEQERLLRYKEQHHNTQQLRERRHSQNLPTTPTWPTGLSGHETATHTLAPNVDKRAGPSHCGGADPASIYSLPWRSAILPAREGETSGAPDNIICTADQDQYETDHGSASRLAASSRMGPLQSCDLPTFLRQRGGGHESAKGAVGSAKSKMPANCSLFV